MTKARMERLSRTVAGDVLKDMIAECVRYKTDNGHRPDRVQIPADQFDRLCAAMNIHQFSLPDIGILERRLGYSFDGGEKITIELVPNDRIQGAMARGRQIIEPPRLNRKIIKPASWR